MAAPKANPKSKATLDSNRRATDPNVRKYGGYRHDEQMTCGFKERFYSDATYNWRLVTAALRVWEILNGCHISQIKPSLYKTRQHRHAKISSR